MKVVACMNQIAAFGQVSCTNLITALRYAWTNKSIRVLSLMQYVGMEWTKHWHSSNNDISKELWAYLPNVMVHYLCEDFAAMICHSQKGCKGIFLPCRKHVLCANPSYARNMPLAKCSTQIYHLSDCPWRASFADSEENCAN